MSAVFGATMFHFLMIGVVAARSSKGTVFSLQVTSPDYISGLNISFTMDTFMKFYNCLSSATSCSVFYTEHHDLPLDNNVLKVTTSHEPSSAHQPLVWICRRTRAGQIKCSKDDTSLELHTSGSGIKPLVSCGGALCQCVRISGNVKISFNAARIKDCSDRILEVDGPKKRSKRQYRRTTYVRIRTNYGTTHDLSALSVGEIVGMVIGIIIGVPILIFVSCVVYILLQPRCCPKPPAEKTDENTTTPEIGMEPVEINHSGDSVSDKSQDAEVNEDKQDIDQGELKEVAYLVNEDKQEIDQGELKEVAYLVNEDKQEIDQGELKEVAY